MYEEKFNTSFEAKLAKLKAEKQSRIDLVEAEKLRKATDPSEIEKVEASLWLQQELRDVGEIFVAKAEDLGIKPGRGGGWSGTRMFDDDICKTYWIGHDGLMTIEEVQYRYSDHPKKLKVRTNRSEIINGHATLGMEPIENYLFTVSSTDEGKKFLDETTTALVDILGDLATKSGAI